MKVYKKTKLLYGIGINDADYPTQPKINGKRVICPYYRIWSNMLSRAYGKNNYHTYSDCEVDVRWHRFSNFKAWMEQQDWEGMELDKDIIRFDNKIYCPEYCYFVPKYMNSLVLLHTNKRGPLMIGVNHKTDHYRAKEYMVNINRLSIKQPSKSFETELAAHMYWQETKIETLIFAITKYRLEANYSSKIESGILDRINILRYHFNKNMEFNSYQREYRS